MADVSLIKFQLGGIDFCVHADQILEIVRYTGVRKIPKPLPYVVGLIELRKHIVVVVDLRKRLGLSPIVLSKDTVMIVANLAIGMTGILAESISDFLRIPEEMILLSISIAGFPEQLISGVLAEEDDIMIIPNFDKIFSSYINIRLVPVSPSEKIAFQYRFTPGALTRTLENNLLTQQYLDHETVRKLPRSMCIPSVRVHKMTSYYPKFQPRKPYFERKAQQYVISQELRAGDEKYLALSRQVRPQQDQQLYTDNAEKENQGVGSDIIDPLISDAEVPVPDRLEKILRRVECCPDLPASQNIPIDALTSQPIIGRRIAETLQVASTRIMKYFTYYPYFSPPEHAVRAAFEQLPGMMQRSQSEQDSEQDSEQAFEQRLQELFIRNRPAKKEDGYSCLLQTLQVLHEEQRVLSRQHLEKICLHYQVSPVKIAQLASFFPDYAFGLETEQALADESLGEIEEQKPPQDTGEEASSLGSELQALSFEPASTSISECIHHLVEENKLDQDQYIRYVASQIRVPTCRLSKFRSYYRWNNEQTNR